ncbi:Aspartate carbamoyltransferase regulatory chain [Raoultella terrigena]|uniref:Aspartate carbamoyltransferase regulatory chain n=1 Tax=Raoultella terrigena TaxID=577 RepID=A0A3P8M4Y0_RAOTE|nr:Aspartate carbamoyltransferase regulatory chain [Raoultella terrigena]
MTHDNKLQVEAIKRGTVIDHIPAQVGFKLLTLFKLTETDQRITIGLNLPSGEMGRKDLIKIENTFLTDEQVNQLALYAPLATVNRIDDYEVVASRAPICRSGLTACWCARTATASATPSPFPPALR